VLQVFSVDIERQIIGVDDGLHKVEVFGKKFFKLVIDKHSSDI